MITLLIVTDTAILGPGGSERFLCNLLAGLDPARYRVDVVQLTAPLPPAQQLRRSPGPHVRLEYRPIGAAYGLRALRVYLELRRRVRRGDYAIVQSQHEKADLLCALLPRAQTREQEAGGEERDAPLLPLPIPAPSVPAPLRISNRRDTGFQKGRLLRASFRALNRRFDRFVAPSRDIIDGLVRDERVPAERTHCLPNGVDSARFAPLDADARGWRRERIGIPRQAFVFGCVARMVPVKRHRDLLSAFAQATAARADALLVLVGTGPLEDELRLLAQQLGVGARVLFCGERGDVEQLLPLFDVFVLSSSTEGMSNAVLEAMACGLAVVATAVGGNAELIADGSTGLLVPPCEPPHLAAAMRLLLQQPARARALGDAARRAVVERYSVTAMVRGFQALYTGDAVAA